MSTDKTEPPDSARSSPDDVCQCGHARLDHQDSEGPFVAQCDACRSENWRHAFALAKPEAPVPVREDCGVCGEPHDSMDCPGPEAPETVNPLPGLEDMKPVGWTAEWADGVQPMSRRPPYAVAYAIEGGAQYEIALPGDASVRAVDGTLIITHDSAVLALSHVRPMEA